MKVELVDIDQVVPYIKNPRKKKSLAKVEKSIKDFGFRQPIVVDKDMVIVIGHSRWQVARNLGLKRVPIHKATDLTAKKIAALRIVDNRSHEDSEWDDKLLAGEIDFITEDKEYSIMDLGFEDYQFKIDDDGEKPKKAKKEPVYKTIFEVVVECADEKEQKLIYETLTQKGHKCRVLSM